MNELIMKSLRHGLAALAGYLGSMGFAPEGLQTAPLLSALACFGISSLWSWLAQPYALSANTRIVRGLAASLSQQLIAFLAGWIQAHGGGVDVADPVAVTLFASNLAVSNLKQLVRPGVIGQWLMIAVLPCMSMSCVTQQSTETEVTRAQAAVEAADFIMELARIYWEGIRNDPTQDPQTKAAAELAFREAAKRLDAERARLAVLRDRFAASAIPPLLPSVAPATP